MAICVALAGESVAGGSLDPISIATALTGTGTGEPERGMFLVARRALDGPHFGQSVVYLVEHGEDGTLGLIVNRSSDISLSEAVPGIEDKQATAHALYYGGPVGLPMILLLMRSESNGTCCQRRLYQFRSTRTRRGTCGEETRKRGAFLHWAFRMGGWSARLRTRAWQLACRGGRY